jgi:hypothetical protein
MKYLLSFVLCLNYIINQAQKDTIFIQSFTIPCDITLISQELVKYKDINNTKQVILKNSIDKIYIDYPPKWSFASELGFFWISSNYLGVSQLPESKIGIKSEYKTVNDSLSLIAKKNNLITPPSLNPSDIQLILAADELRSFSNLNYGGLVISFIGSLFATYGLTQQDRAITLVGGTTMLGGIVVQIFSISKIGKAGKHLERSVLFKNFQN